MSDSEKLIFSCPPAKLPDRFLSEVNSNMADRSSSICDYYQDATSKGLALSLNTAIKPIYASVFGHKPLEIDFRTAKPLKQVEVNCEHDLQLWETIMFQITWFRNPHSLPLNVDANLSNLGAELCWFTIIDWRGSMTTPMSQNLMLSHTYIPDRFAEVFRVLYSMLFDAILSQVLRESLIREVPARPPYESCVKLQELYCYRTLQIPLIHLVELNDALNQCANELHSVHTKLDSHFSVWKSIMTNSRGMRCFTVLNVEMVLAIVEGVLIYSMVFGKNKGCKESYVVYVACSSILMSTKFLAWMVSATDISIMCWSEQMQCQCQLDSLYFCLITNEAIKGIAIALFGDLVMRSQELVSDEQISVWVIKDMCSKYADVQILQPLCSSKVKVISSLPDTMENEQGIRSDSFGMIKIYFTVEHKEGMIMKLAGNMFSYELYFHVKLRDVLINSLKATTASKRYEYRVHLVNDHALFTHPPQQVTAILTLVDNIIGYGRLIGDLGAKFRMPNSVQLFVICVLLGIHEFILFSSPRPPDVNDLEDKVILKGGGMLRALI